MIDAYKFLSGKYDINCTVKLQLHSCRGSLSLVETRGNLYKLVPDRSKYELRRLLPRDASAERGYEIACRPSVRDV